MSPAKRRIGSNLKRIDDTMPTILAQLVAAWPMTSLSGDTPTGPSHSA